MQLNPLKNQFASKFKDYFININLLTKKLIPQSKMMNYSKQTLMDLWKFQMKNIFNIQMYLNQLK